MTATSKPNQGHRFLHQRGEPTLWFDENLELDIQDIDCIMTSCSCCWGASRLQGSTINRGRHERTVITRAEGGDTATLRAGLRQRNL